MEGAGKATVGWGWRLGVRRGERKDERRSRARAGAVPGGRARGIPEVTGGVVVVVAVVVVVVVKVVVIDGCGGWMEEGKQLGEREPRTNHGWCWCWC